MPTFAGGTIVDMAWEDYGVPVRGRPIPKAGEILPGDKYRIPQSWVGPDDAQPVLTSGKGTPDGIGGNPNFYRHQRGNH